MLILDVNEEEAAKLLATLDPLGAMAGADAAKLDALLSQVETDSGGLQDMLDGLAAANPLEEERYRDSTGRCSKPPPAMSWVLIGIETVRFGEIQEAVDMLSANRWRASETTVSDRPKGE